MRHAVTAAYLYCGAADVAHETVPVTLMPYYAWCNRGECEMRVWMPLV